MKNCFATSEVLLALLMLLLILYCGINPFDMQCFSEFSFKEKQVYFGGGSTTGLTLNETQDIQRQS